MSINRGRSLSLSPTKRRGGSSVSPSKRHHPRDPHEVTNPKRFLHDGKLCVYDGNIFDKLLDPQLYTGSHKYRFDVEGRGLGLYGRDQGACGYGSVASSTMRAGGDLDIHGMRWAAGLRRNFHHRTEVKPTRRTSVSPVKTRVATVPRVEVWTKDANGNHTIDHYRTHQLLFGPDRLLLQEEDIWNNRHLRRRTEEECAKHEVMMIHKEEESKRRARQKQETYVCRVQESGQRIIDDGLTQFLYDASGDRKGRPALTTGVIPHPPLAQPAWVPAVSKPSPYPHPQSHHSHPQGSSSLDLNELVRLVEEYDAHSTGAR
eukprot:PhF_6_TR30598/c0_g1_i1/m.45033